MAEAPKPVVRSPLVIVFCLLAALCEGFDVQAPGVASVGLRQEFASSAGWLGVLFSASNVGLLIGAIVGGRLADRFGRKAVLAASLGTFGVFSLLTALGDSMPALSALRFLTGLGLGGAMPNVIALAAESSSGNSRNTRIAVSYLGFPVGSVISSLVMLALGPDRWRLVFVVGGLVPLGVALALALAMPSTPTTASRAAGSDGGFGAELLAPARRSRTALLWLGFFLIVLTLHLLLNWLPILLTGRGLSRGEALTALMGFNLGGALTALLMGVLLDSRWRQAALALCGFALPALLFALALGDPAVAIVQGLAVLLGGAVLASQIALYGAAEAAYPSHARGLGIGAAVAAGRVGSIVGPLFAAALIDSGRATAAVFAGIVPIVVLCSVCVVALSWRAAPR